MTAEQGRRGPLGLDENALVLAERQRRSDADVVRAELSRVLASPGFDASERNRQFLNYVVEEALAGRGERIKAYSIATAVFGRDSSFDPILDSIVRIEASRLRRSLEHYYLTAGPADPVRITIPKGSYVPVFEPVEVSAVVHVDECAQASAHPTPSYTRARHGVGICVQPFEEDGNHAAFPDFSRGLTRQIIVGLTRFTNLMVFAGEQAPAMAGPSRDPVVGGTGDVDFLLTGGTTLAANQFSLEIMLRDARTGRFLWGERFERTLSPAEILAVRDEVANSVVRCLAQPYGVIFCSSASGWDGGPPESLTSFNAVARFYEYRRNFDPNLFEAARTSLEEVILADPAYAEAYACLSLIHTDAFRFGFSVHDVDPLRRAIVLARRSIELAPRSSRGYHALSLAYWFGGDPRAGLSALETAWSLNPNDTDIMAELGLRYAVRAEWQKAVPLLEGSYARNPAQPDTFRCGLVLYHYAHGRYQEALFEARRVGTTRNIFGAMFLAISAAQLGLQQEAKDALSAMLKIDPRYGQHAFADLRARHAHPDLVNLIVDGLRKAGLAVADTATVDGACSATPHHQVTNATVRQQGTRPPRRTSQ